EKRILTCGALPNQPWQPRVRVHLEDRGHSAEAQAFRQRAHRPPQPVRGDTFPMQRRAMRLKKIPVTGAAIELSPGTATGMTVGRDIAQPEPAPIATVGIGADMTRGVDVTAAASR